MCSIIGSFNKNEITKLVSINQFRGAFSNSITNYDYKNNKIIDIINKQGEFKRETIDNIIDNYMIVHLRAPTDSNSSVCNTHPAMHKSSMLWHNGLLTPRGIKYCQSYLDTTETFDTKLLLMMIDRFGFQILSEIEGLFTCVYYDGSSWYVFRTKHGKLYVDENLNMSSERFEKSKCINYDVVYTIDFDNKCLNPGFGFKTKRFNIIVDGEL